MNESSPRSLPEPAEPEGSSIRSRHLIMAQRDAGLGVAVLSSPFQAPSGELDKHGREYLDYIAHYRSWNRHDYQAVRATGSGWRGRISKLRQLPAFKRRVHEVACLEGVDLIHAHGMFYVGQAAHYAARKLECPWLYEVRSVWEDNAVLHGVYGACSFFPAVIRRQETHCCRRADGVTTICEGLKRELSGRGIPAAKITLMPNCVVPEEDQSPPATDFTIGYVGGLARTEGLHLILHAAALCRDRIPGLRILLVGDGGEAAALRTLGEELGLTEILTMPGQIPADLVGDYFRRIRVFIVPRVRDRVTELVTPIKPLEAMNHGCLVLVSDVGGLLELIEPDRTGLSFPADDAEALATCLLRIAADPVTAVKLAAAGRDWVRAERDWARIGESYRDLYTKILECG